MKRFRPQNNDTEISEVAFNRNIMTVKMIR